MDWGELRAHIVMCTGWEWDYVGQHMDIPRWRAMQRYLKRWPPLHQMVAVYLGLGKEEKPERGSMGELTAAFGMFGIQVSQGNVPKPPTIQ